jgi:hypothetical protein
MAKRPGGFTVLGKIRSSPASGAQAAFSALHKMRKSHYSGEAFERGSSGEMSIKALSKIHNVPEGAQGKKPKGYGA